MGGRAALLAYIALCGVIAGCAIYMVSQATGRPDLEHSAEGVRLRAMAEARRRAMFRDDVRDAVGSALQVWAATGGRVAAEPKYLDEVYAGRPDLVREGD